MKLRFWNAVLQLANPWKIASSRGPGDYHHVVLVELKDADGLIAYGEAAPSALYGESPDTTGRFLSQVDVSRLSFDDLAGSMAYLATLTPRQSAATCALNLALLDGAAKRAGQPLHDFLGLGFREGRHVTSFSIGIAAPDTIRRKTAEAAAYPILKLKMGDPRDRENLAALRATAPDKPVRVDANEGWRTKEQALTMLEWLAADGKIEFVEQPMHRTTRAADLAWLKERSPLPIFADEACHTVKDIPHCAEFYHGVNLKLMKTGGLTMAQETLVAARRAGLKTMLGCMIETSVLISAAAHLAELTDYLDLDGNILTVNDSFQGVTAENGLLSFATAPEKHGLRVRPR